MKQKVSSQPKSAADETLLPDFCAPHIWITEQKHDVLLSVKTKSTQNTACSSSLCGWGGWTDSLRTVWLLSTEREDYSKAVPQSAFHYKENWQHEQHEEAKKLPACYPKQCSVQGIHPIPLELSSPGSACCCCYVQLFVFNQVNPCLPSSKAEDEANTHTEHYKNIRGQTGRTLPDWNQDSCSLQSRDISM